MKRLQIIIIAGVSAVVILTALGVGFYIGKAGHEKEEGGKPRQVGQEGLTPGGAGSGRFSNLSQEERARIAEGRKERAERWANMSDEEKEKFRQQLRRGFNVRRDEAGRLPSLSEEERAKLGESWANMSMQEREEFRAKMRERSGAAQRDPNAVLSEPNVVGREPNAVEQEPNAIRQEKK